jgi:hypothetical protein
VAQVRHELGGLRHLGPDGRDRGGQVGHRGPDGRNRATCAPPRYSR